MSAVVWFLLLIEIVSGSEDSQLIWVHSLSSTVLGRDRSFVTEAAVLPSATIVSSVTLSSISPVMVSRTLSTSQ